MTMSFFCSSNLWDSLNVLGSRRNVTSVNTFVGARYYMILQSFSDPVIQNIYTKHIYISLLNGS